MKCHTLIICIALQNSTLYSRCQQDFKTQTNKYFICHWYFRLFFIWKKVARKKKILGQWKTKLISGRKVKQVISIKGMPAPWINQKNHPYPWGSNGKWCFDECSFWKYSKRQRTQNEMIQCRIQPDPGDEFSVWNHTESRTASDIKMLHSIS